MHPPTEHHPAIAAAHLAGKKRQSSAHVLLQTGDASGAVELLLQSVKLFARAKLEASQQQAPEAAAADQLDQLVHVLQMEGITPPRGLHRRDAFLLSPTDLDHLPSTQLHEIAEELDVLADDLSKLVDVRSETERCASRIVHCALVVLMVLVPVVALLYHLLQPQNLALNSAVKGTRPAFNSSLAGAVDGIKFGQLGFHSDALPSPELVIDLAREYNLKKLKAFGRSDCCFNQSIPLSVELSQDGKQYARVASRTTPFTTMAPWIVDLGGTKARYVKLVTAGPYLVLSEVELFEE